MSLFNRALRPPPTLSDAAIERHLSALRSQIEPDPLFRRRLRSEVTNRFVAAREGTAQGTDASLRTSEMGRLGRACLYATFTLAAGATSVLAASEQAIPGDALYPLKLRIEEVRLEILPNHLHGELAGYALGERIEEMARLTQSGRLDLAAAMAAQIDRAYDELVSLGESTGPARAARIERHLLVLDALLAKLPPAARDAVERAMSPGHDAQPGDPAKEVSGAHLGAPLIGIQPACLYSGVPGATALGCPVETRCSMSAVLPWTRRQSPTPSTSSHRMSWVPA